MASIASVDVHEAVSRSAREDGKSYDEALKEFLERFERSLLNHAWIEANLNKKEDAQFLKDCQQRAAKAYQNAKKNTRPNPKAFSTGLRTTWYHSRKNRNNLEL